MLSGVEATFGTVESESQWLTTIYMLVVGITVPLVTHLSNKMDIRRLTLVALGLFLLGAAIDFFAPNFIVLIIGRIPQAAAAGITMPMIQAMAMTHFPRNLNGTAMGIGGIALGFAPNIGPIIGGALVDTLGWRSFFVILAGVVIILVIAALIVIPKEGAPARDSNLDFLSFLLSTLGFGGLLLGLTNAANMPLTDMFVIIPLLIGVLFLVVFVFRQMRIKNPLIDMSIFKISDYRISFIAQCILYASFMGITLVVPLFVQNVLGRSAFDAGVVFIPATICAIVFNPLAGVLMDRVGVRPIAICASILMAIGAGSMAFVNDQTPLWALAVMQTIRGIGISSLIGPLTSWGMMKLPGKTTMSGSAFAATARQACASFGTAIMMIAITLVPLTTIGASASAALGYDVALGISATLALALFGLIVFKVR